MARQRRAFRFARPSRIGARGDEANAFERRDALQKCRDIFLSLKDEPFVHVIDTSGSLDEVQDSIRASLITDH